MRGTLITACAGVASFVGSIVVPVIFPNLDLKVAYGLAGMAIVLLVFAFGLWWAQRHDAGEGGLTQTTSGPHSPNIGTARDVHFHAAPAPTQQPKSPYGSARPYDIDKLNAGLERVLIAAGSREMRGQANPLGLARFVSKPKPDLPLTGLLVRVYAALGPPPQGDLEEREFWRSVNLAIADKVVSEELHVWARMGDRALALTPLDRWEVGEFDHKKGSLHVPVAYSEGYELTDLHFYKAEIDRIWPEGSRTTNDGKP
jgi:hypothetical protein